MQTSKLILTGFAAAICSLAATSILAAEVTDGPKYNFVCADFAKGEICVVDSKGNIKQTKPLHRATPKHRWGFAF